MEENEEELVKKFKALEKKLRAEIKKMPSSIQDSNDTKVLKQRIKSYIEQLNAIEVILEEYEGIASKIEKLANGKKSGEKISKTVVDFRPTDTVRILDINKQGDSETEKEEPKENQDDMIEEIVVNGKVLGVKRKKKSDSSKEM